MGIGRRFPVYIRPLPALASLLAIVLGFAFGLNWAWDWALQTGNIFVLIQIESQLISFTGMHSLWLIVFVLGLAGFTVFGRVSKNAAAKAANKGARGIFAPRARFYPVVFMFGLFLIYFGTTFLFKASVAGDDSVSGLVLFVYLNYDGIFNRAFISLFGAALLLFGAYSVTYLTFQPGLGLDVRPLSQVARTTRPDLPTAEAEKEDGWEVVTPPTRPTPMPRPTPTAARPATMSRSVATTPRPAPTPRPATPAATPRRAPSTSPPSSASRPARSPASRAPPARTAARSTPPSTE